jgi:hypothetical protein
VILSDIPGASDQCVKTVIFLLTAQEVVTEAYIANCKATTQQQRCIHCDRSQIFLAPVPELTFVADNKIMSCIDHSTVQLPNPLLARRPYLGRSIAKHASDIGSRCCPVRFATVGI